MTEVRERAVRDRLVGLFKGPYRCLFAQLGSELLAVLFNDVALAYWVFGGFEL